MDPKLLRILKTGNRIVRFNGKTYELLGRGGEANVYTYDKKHAIKVYRSPSCDLYNFSKEMYALQTLADIPQLSDHVIKVEHYEPCQYVLMNVYDGDLDSWGKIATTRGTEATDNEWIAMIFQVAYAFFDLNSRGVLHADPKPKNIFYKKCDKFEEHSYMFDGNAYKIGYNTIFALGDFSRVRIAELDPDHSKLLPGQSGTEDLYDDLVNHTDLYELSRLLYRLQVNSMLKNFPKDVIEEMVLSYETRDEEFKNKKAMTEKDIQDMNLPENIKIKMRDRFYAYALIEANIITIDRIMQYDEKIIFPSKIVFEMFENLGKPEFPFQEIFSDFSI